MASCLYTNFFVVAPPTATPVLVAGNYYLETISMGITHLGAVGAGFTEMSLVLASPSRQYATLVGTVIAGAAGAFAVDYQFQCSPRLLMVRGDSLQISNANVSNCNNSTFFLNLYGAQMP